MDRTPCVVVLDDHAQFYGLKPVVAAERGVRQEDQMVVGVIVRQGLVGQLGMVAYLVPDGAAVQVETVSFYGTPAAA